MNGFILNFEFGSMQLRWLIETFIYLFVTLDLADEIDMVKGKERAEQNSRFLSYAAAVKDEDDIKAAYLKVKTKFPGASHVVCAYRLQGEDTPYLQDYIDDGEIGAGRTILKVLKDQQLMNIVIFMVRYYGGKHLGSKRFDVFKEVTESAIDALQKRIQRLKQEEEERKRQEEERQIALQNAWPEETSSTPMEDWSNIPNREQDEVKTD